MASRTVWELAALCGAVVEGDGSRRVDGPASLRDASSNHVSFYDDSPRYREDLYRTAAGVVVVGRESAVDRRDLVLLRSTDPSAAFSAIVESFEPLPARPPSGVHPSAVIDPTAELAADVAVGPLCVLGPRVRVGKGAILRARVTLGADVAVGEGSELHPGVVLYDGVTIGSRCILHAGAVVGADGFGFDRTDSGWRKVLQLGTVVVEDDVEIGANSTIDRARFGATRIGRGVKLDNLVHIGHNVEIGPNALLIAQVGISGSARIGADAILAGQAGIGGHLEIGKGARVGAQAGVTGDIPEGSDVWGTPARAHREVLRQAAELGRLGALREEVRDLRRRIQELEERGAS
jgi:UDP-3-O-[3-hydroxymyristoyl] glucosamine N-acyltransferase